MGSGRTESFAWGVQTDCGSKTQRVLEWSGTYVGNPETKQVQDKVQQCKATNTRCEHMCL